MFSGKILLLFLNKLYVELLPSGYSRYLSALDLPVNIAVYFITKFCNIIHLCIVDN